MQWWQCCSLLFLYKKLGNESKVREIVDEYAQNISLIEGKSEKEMLKEIGEFLEKIEQLYEQGKEKYDEATFH